MLADGGIALDISNGAYSRLVELHGRYREEPVGANIGEIVLEEFGIDLSCTYGSTRLKNPLIVAPGQMTIRTEQIAVIAEAGYGSAALKSFLGEASDGSCSMPDFRSKPSWVKSYYEADDTAKARPIIHWDGRLDTRDLAHYLPFAQESLDIEKRTGMPVIASILCHLPNGDEDWLADEWVHTTRAIYDLGYRLFEVDFCPFLKSESKAENRKTVLRWYRECIRLMKDAVGEIEVFPKMLNLQYGEEFFLETCFAAIEGGADGLVVANRIYKDEFGSGHGGEELRQLNLGHVRACREAGISVPISATGGIYTGIEALDYIAAGAENVQLLSMIMGRVEGYLGPGNKFQQVFYKLMLDPNDGLIAGMLAIKEKYNIDRIIDLVGSGIDIRSVQR